MSRRRGPSEQVLIAGTEQDLPLVRDLIETLDDDTYGQILLELPAECSLGMPTPPRVSVQILARPAHDDTLALGTRLARALQLWAEEWLSHGDRDLLEDHWLWVGGRQHRAVDVVREVLFADSCVHLRTAAPSAEVPLLRIADE